MDSINYPTEKTSVQENEALNLLMLVGESDHKGPVVPLGNNYRRTDCKVLKFDDDANSVSPQIGLDVISKECFRGIIRDNSGLEYYGPKKK